MKKVLLFLSMVLIFGLAGCTVQEPTDAVSIKGIEIINETNSRILYVGETLQLSAKVYASVENLKVAWSSKDENIATVDELGHVIALKAGKVEIIATCEENEKITQKYALIVEEKPAEEILPTSVVINSLNDQTTCKVGEKINLTATVMPHNATQKVEWTSSDPLVATVVRGIVTPLAVGTVTITASVKGYPEISDTINLTFEKADNPALTKDWPNMIYASHEEYLNSEDETPLKVKGVVVHISPVKNNQVTYVIQNGNKGYYVYAQNSSAFPVELGKTYEVGGFKKNYRGLHEIVDVEYFNELEESIECTINVIDGVDPTSLEEMNEFHASLIKGRAEFVSCEVSTKAYNFTALFNGEEATFRVDPAYMTDEEFNTISNKLAVAIPGTEFDFIGLVTAFGYGAPSPQIQITSDSYINFDAVDDEVLLNAAMDKVIVPSIITSTKDEISIPTEIEGYDEIDLSWESDSNLIDLETGKVTHLEEDVTVTLTLTLSLNGKELSKEFTLVVSALINRDYQELVVFDLDDALDASAWGNSDSKPSYKEGTVVLGTPAHTWLLRNALIAATSGDKYEGKFAIRAQAGSTSEQTARIEIQHDDEYNCVEFQAAIYGSDASGIQIKIEYSTDEGDTWLSTDTIVVESTALETFRIALPDGVKRIAIVVVENSGRRVNIDEIKLLK